MNSALMVRLLGDEEKQGIYDLALLGD